MRVAVFVGVYPLISETFVIQQIADLRSLGHEVDVYVEYRPRRDRLGPAGPALLDNTTYMDTPRLRNGQRFLTALPRALVCFRHAPGLTLRALNPAEYGSSALSLSALHRLYRLATIPGARYDVLHAHFGMVGERFRFAATLWDTPLVVSFHGMDFSVWTRTHGRGCYRRLFEAATAVTANSEHTRRRLEGLECPAEKIHKIYSAWDMHAFTYVTHLRRSGEPTRVLSVARLVEKKGVEYVIRAVALARCHHPNLRYDVVGDGPLRPRLEALIAALGLEGVVTLHGAQPPAEVQRMMAKAHIFAHASVTTAEGDEEGQGVVLVEAQASGIPVIATQHGPFEEMVVDGVTGLLVPERDHVALADRLIYLAERPDTADAMGRAGREHVEKQFDSRQLSQQVVATYEWAIERRQARTPVVRQV